MRGLAALYVLIHHSDYLLRRGYLYQIWFEGGLNPARTHPQLYHALTTALSFFRWGHAAVVFFFVLSGFVIHLRYAKQLAGEEAAKKRGEQPQRTRFAVGDYFWRRARRIYPPLIAAIILTAILDAVSNHWNFSSPRYSEASHNHGPLILFGNLAFLMEIYVPQFGSDLPLWSLAYEAWFYILYPLLWLGSRRSIAGVTAVVIAVAAGIIGVVTLALPGFHLPVLVAKILGCLPAWWFGAILADIYTRRIRFSFAWLIPLIVLLGWLHVQRFPEQLKTDILALGFAGLIALCFSLEQRGWRLTILNRFKPLGDFSYSLYVMHYPILLFLSGLLLAKRPSNIPPDAPWMMLGGMAIALVFTWTVHWIVEVPFIGSRRRNLKAQPSGYATDAKAPGKVTGAAVG